MKTIFFFISINFPGVGPSQHFPVFSGLVKKCHVNQDFFHFAEEKFSQKIKLQAL